MYANNEDDMQTKSAAVEKFLANLASTDLLLTLNWDEWLTIEAPYAERENIQPRRCRALQPKWL